MVFKIVIQEHNFELEKLKEMMREFAKLQSERVFSGVRFEITIEA